MIIIVVLQGFKSNCKGAERRFRVTKKERGQKRRVKTQLKTNTYWKKENNSKMPTTEKRARFAAV